MTAPADCLISTKVLFSDNTFSLLHFMFLLLIKLQLWEFVDRGYKNEDFFFSLLTIIDTKINMNVPKAISPRQ